MKIGKRDQRSKNKLVLPLLALGGAIVAFFFDPQNGRQRRAQLLQRVPALFRRHGRGAAHIGQAASSTVYGATQKATHLTEEPKDYNDPTLKGKVETELFRDADVPKGQIDVNVQDGVVQLRGEVPRPEMIDELVEKTRSIQGVRDVENLLHLPGTPAQMHE